MGDIVEMGARGAEDGAEGLAERRKAVRHAVDGEAEVLFADGTMVFYGRIRNVTEDGCYIETRARLRMKPGTAVSMVFRVDGNTFRIAASSRAVRREDGAGFLFEGMDDETRETLRLLIEELAIREEEEWNESMCLWEE